MGENVPETGLRTLIYGSLVVGMRFHRGWNHLQNRREVLVLVEHQDRDLRIPPGAIRQDLVDGFGQRLMGSNNRSNRQGAIQERFVDLCRCL